MRLTSILCALALTLVGCAHRPTCAEMYADPQQRLQCQQMAMQMYRSSMQQMSSGLNAIEAARSGPQPASSISPEALRPRQQTCTLRRMGNTVYEYCQ